LETGDPKEDIRRSDDMADLARSIQSAIGDALSWTPEWLIGVAVLTIAPP
jgi:hypothetical protein